MNPLSSYPEYITPNDMKDATQYSLPVVYQIIREMEAYQTNHPGEPRIVHRRPSGRGIRIHRDGFFRFFARREDMPEMKELMRA